MKKHLIIFEGSRQVALEDNTNYTPQQLEQLIEIQKMLGRWVIIEEKLDTANIGYSPMNTE
jgi:hypothetical protein